LDLGASYILDKPAPKTWLVIAAFAAIYLIWGSTYLAIWFGLKSIPPFTLGAIRFFVAGLLLLAWCHFRGERLNRESLLKNSFAGVLMSGFGTGAVIWVEQYITSGLAAIIVASLPFWFVIFDYKHWSENFHNKLILVGVAIGFIGVMLLFNGKTTPPHLSSDVSQMASIAILLAGCIAWASGSLYLKYSPATTSTTMNVGVQMLAPGIACGIVAWAVGEWSTFQFTQVTIESWLAIVYLVVFGSLVAFVSYVWLLQVRPTVMVGTYAYVNPIVAVVLGWLLASEPIGLLQLFSLVIILTGVLLINFERYTEFYRAKPEPVQQA
jgi:drug/metabolite transporter (DMT)-like permease